MRRTRSKLAVFIIAAIVSLAMAVPAFATSSPTEGATAAKASSTSTANVTVATGNAGDTLSAYKVVSATLDTSANTLTYTFTDSFKAFQAQSTNDTYKNLTADGYCAMTTDSTEFKSLLGAYSAYLMKQSPIPAAEYTATTDASGSATFADMPMGQYIIIGTGSTTGAIVYQTVTAEVVPTVEDNAYVIYPTYNVTMKTTKPTGEKTLDSGYTEDKYNNSTVDTAAIGGTLTYTLHGTVPTYSENATNTTYYMGDVLSNGLTLKSAADKIVVKGYAENDTTGTVLTYGTDYTVTISGQQLYIDYNYAKIKQYKTLTATYDVILNDNAKVGMASGNPNTYTLVWSNNPFNGGTSEGHPTSGTPGYGSTGNEKIVYTYGLYINKYEEISKEDKLAGATFELKDNNGKVLATLVTDENGYASYNGLAAGTYTLTETVAPTGYKLATQPISITLDASTATGTATITKTSTTYTTVAGDSKYGVQAMDENGTPLWLASGATGGTPTASATQPAGMVPAYVVSTTTVTGTVNDDAGAGSGYWPANVANAKGNNLPTTGGMGTTLLYIIGAGLVIVALVALITKKCVNKKQA